MSAPWAEWGPVGVVIAAPVFDDHPGFAQRVEAPRVEQFIRLGIGLERGYGAVRAEPGNAAPPAAGSADRRHPDSLMPFSHKSIGGNSMFLPKCAGAPPKKVEAVTCVPRLGFEPATTD